MSLTRRTLLRRGGATAAGAGVLGSLTRAAPAAAKLGDDRARGVLIVVLPLVRATHVDAFEDGAPREDAEPERPDGEVAPRQPRAPRVACRRSPPGARS